MIKIKREMNMNFETKCKIEIVAVVVGGLILFSLPIVLMAVAG